jgi:hypothetical protein
MASQTSGTDVATKMNAPSELPFLSLNVDGGWCSRDQFLDWICLKMNKGAIGGQVGLLLQQLNSQDQGVKQASIFFIGTQQFSLRAALMVVLVVQLLLQR